MQTPALDILEARKEAGLGDMARAGLMAGALAGGAHGLEAVPGGGFKDIGGNVTKHEQIARGNDRILASTGHPLASYATGGQLQPGTLPTGYAADAANHVHQKIKQMATGPGGLLDQGKLDKMAPKALPVLNEHLQSKSLPTIAPFKAPSAPVAAR